MSGERLLLYFSVVKKGAVVLLFLLLSSHQSSGRARTCEVADWRRAFRVVGSIADVGGAPIIVQAKVSPHFECARVRSVWLLWSAGHLSQGTSPTRYTSFFK